MKFDYLGKNYFPDIQNVYESFSKTDMVIKCQDERQFLARDINFEFQIFSVTSPSNRYAEH